VNDYHAIETLGRLKMQEIQREVAMAALATRLASDSRPGYRARLASSLSGLARRVDPSGDVSIGSATLTALHQG
jgi:hypothetical protein